MSQTMITLVAAVAGEGAGDAGPRPAVASIAAAFTTAVARHRGREVPGNALGAAFGNVRDAIACALEVQGGDGRATRAVDLRLALHAGEIVEEDGRLVGEAMITAASLVHAVGSQQIWCSGGVRELAAGVPGVEFVPAGMVAAGPLDRPRAVYRVVRRSPSWGLTPPMVGRQGEAEELRRHLHHALVGRGGVVLLSGEAGVGKSYLARDLASDAAGWGARVLTGRCQEAAGVPYLPFVEMVEALVGGIDSTDAVRQLLGDDAPQLAKIVPRLRVRLPDMPAPLQLAPEQEHRFLFDSIHTFLARLSAVRPLVLILEDAHWADDASMLLVRHLAERVGDLPLLVLATCRDGPLDMQEPFAAVLEDLLRRGSVHRLRLRRLSAPEVGAMLSGLALHPPPQELVEAIWAETDGNPFFIEELYRHLDEEGKLFDERGHFLDAGRVGSLVVPDTVRLTLQRRLDRLGPSVGQVLSAAAVIGRDFPVKLLGALREVGSEELFEALERAEESGLVYPSGPGSRFVFTHELVRQTLLAGTTTIRRQRLHARVADAIIRLADDAEQYATEIAHHLDEAGDAADPPTAVRFLTVAGERAVDAAAYADALSYYDRALAHPTSKVGPRAAMLFGRGVARQGVGDWRGAVEDWQAALDAYERIGDPEGLAAVAVRIVRRMSASGRMQDGLAIARRVLPLLGGSITPGRARLLAVTARVEGLAGSYESAAKDLAEALADAETLGDPDLAGVVLAQKGMLHWTHMEASAAAEATQQALAVLDPTSWAASEAMWELHACLLVSGALREVAEGNEQLLAVAARSGNPVTHWTSFLYRSLLAAIDGDLAAMDAHAREGAALCDRAGLPWGSISYSYRGWAEFWRGRWEEAREWFEEAARREAPSFFRGADPAGLAVCLAYRGERDQALALLERLRAQRKLPEAGVPNHLGLWTTLLLAVDALAVLGERAQAAVLYPLVIEAMGTGTVLDLWSGRLLERVAGMAAAAGGQWERAEHHFAAALRQADELPQRLEQPEVRRCYAEMLLERGGPEDCERGRRLAYEAVEQYAALGMIRHAGLTRQLLSSLDARPAALGPTEPVAESAAPRFRLEGEFWAIAYGDRLIRMRDAKGMHYLARLLREPGREFHVLDLSVEETGQPRRGREVGRTAAVVRDDTGAGPVLDAQAKAAYRRRYEELVEEREEAVAYNDLGRAAKVESEMDALTSELARAVGLGGRDRPAASSSERARLNVTRAIRSVMERIGASHPALGEHLRVTVRTGAYCAYEPDPAARIVWEV